MIRINLNEEEENVVLEHMITTKPNTCGKCFCNDLCIFLLMRTGVATTCKDFQRRVQKVVDRENSKSKDKNIKTLHSNEESTFFDISSCITYGDVLYNELHDLKVKPGDLVNIYYSDNKNETVKIRAIEYGDGTIWVEIIK